MYSRVCLSQLPPIKRRAALADSKVVPLPIETSSAISKTRSLVLLSTVKAVPLLIKAKSSETLMSPLPPLTKVIVGELSLVIVALTSKLDHMYCAFEGIAEAFKVMQEANQDMSGNG